MANRSWSGVLLRGTAAAVVPGLVSAIVTRVLMSAIAWITGRVQDPDLQGFLLICLVYVASLLPGCLALAYRATVWSWSLFAAGAAVLVYSALGIGIVETVETVEIFHLSASHWPALVLVLMVMAATYAVQVAAAARWALGGFRNLIPVRVRWRAGRAQVVVYRSGLQGGEGR